MDEHDFEDRVLYYRFYVDEDRRYKTFWVRDPSRRLHWRVQPRVACNSGITSLLLVDHMHDALARGDGAQFGDAIHSFRLRARRVAEEGGDWRFSRCVA